MARASVHRRTLTVEIKGNAQDHPDIGGGYDGGATTGGKKSDGTNLGGA